MPSSYINPKTQVALSSIHKKGLFAGEPIKKDEIIAISGGYVISEQELNETKHSLRKSFKVLKDHLIKIAPGFYLAHFRKEKLYGDDYLNHSCAPNVGLKGNIMFVAMRDIEKGEELTYDYAMTDDDLGVYFKCNCDAENCRRLISGDDWKHPQLQKKYKGYFSWHIQEAINKL